MQKLQAKLKNVPMDAPQVHCSTSMELNREETLSASSKVLTCNTPEVDLHQRTGGLSAVVCVISIDGNPLMPCKPAKARKLLKSGRAKIKKMYPFTIQLNFECENQIQDVTFSEDSGFFNIGFSAVTNKKELVSGTVVLDGRTSSRLTEKRMYRRGRRNKLWYRKPRFNNRKISKGWLPPSTQRRYDAHLKLLKLYNGILPITKIIIETAKFDIQKIENPDISGVEYQQGDMYGYQNMRAYLMAREKGKCQLCTKEFTKGNPSHIHHLKERIEEGSNRAKNLSILHKKCHTNLHKKKLKLPAPKTIKAETFMSIIHKRFLADIPEVEITYGYKTFVDRNKLNIEKTHYNDAFVIAGGANQQRTTPITITQKHRNNRAIQLNRKGFKPAVRKQRYAIQPKDLIWIDGEKHIASGVHCNGTRFVDEKTKKSHSIKKVEKVYNFGSYAFN
jgi:hypothetical protein